LVPTETQWGPVRIKESRLNDTVTNFAPEYEDCRLIAESYSVPLKQVQQESIASYLAQRQTPTSDHGSADQNPAGAKSQVA
jgi:uncharacterized protein (DUF111 family)